MLTQPAAAAFLAQASPNVVVAYADAMARWRVTGVRIVSMWLTQLVSPLVALHFLLLFLNDLHRCLIL